jgi:hypothetical protein
MLSKDMSKIIMIEDNFDMKNQYPNNTIIVDSWKGTPYDNILLGEIFPLLVQCNAVTDVREVIKSHKSKAK